MALPIAFPAMAQQNGAQQNAPPQDQQQMQSNNQGAINQSSDQQLSQDQIRQLQQALDQKGFKSGRAEGKLGPETKQALSSFQKSQNLQQTGEPDQQTMAALGINRRHDRPGSASEPMQGGQNPQGQSGENPAGRN